MSNRLKAAVLAAFPDLARARFRVRNHGWDSVALDVGDRMIFKFPRNPIAERRLRREAGLLAVLEPILPLAVPRMVLHMGAGGVFSSHPKLPGRELEPHEYARLDVETRDRLARDLARVFAALHALDINEMAAVGAVQIDPGANPTFAVPLLPAHLRAPAEALLALPQSFDPLGKVFGFFDAHGWNMAFDHKRGVLNGIFDFADSGLGPLHREFIAPGFIGADLVRRIVAAYSAETGKTPDLDRIRQLTGLYRLQEIVETEDAELRPRMIANFADWVAGK